MLDGQLLLVLLIVAAAAAYLARQVWRSWRGRGSGCGSGCGKCTNSAAPAAEAGKPTFVPAEQLTVRRKDFGRS
jgi:hypothetical protein